MRPAKPKSVELPTYSVLVSPSGEILDLRTHHISGTSSATKLKGRNYADLCGPSYSAEIIGLLDRERSMLSAVMPPPTLGVNAWFAVVGVPLGAKEGGALFVHMDISPWVISESQPESPKEFTMDLLQAAMATTFVGKIEPKNKTKNSIQYDGIESLTTRQREVLMLIGKGKSNAEIAEQLACSLNTVKRHVTAVLQKLKLPNRTRAAMLISQRNT